MCCRLEWQLGSTSLVLQQVQYVVTFRVGPESSLDSKDLCFGCCVVDLDVQLGHG